MIEIPVGSSGQLLIVQDSVLERLNSYRQTKAWHREAGGQLFARVSPLEIYVCEATGPRPTDKRSRYRYQPDRKAEQLEITERHSRGLQYVGDWHTHPERIPHPSGTDYRSISECFAKSGHSLNAFLLFIVGNGPFRRSLHVSLHDKFGLLAELKNSE